MAACAVIANGVAAQDPQAPASKPKLAVRERTQTRITIEVTRREEHSQLRMPACT